MLSFISDQKILNIYVYTSTKFVIAYNNNNMSSSLDVTSNSDNIKAPTFKEGDSVTDFLEQISQYEIQRKKKNYNIILEFMNIWLVPYKFKMDSLLQFKNFKGTRIVANEKHNKKTVKTYATKIKAQLNITDNDDDYVFDEVDTDEVPELEIISLISRILHKIEYSINKKYVGESLYYSIVSKPRKVNK